MKKEFPYTKSVQSTYCCKTNLEALESTSMERRNMQSGHGILKSWSVNKEIFIKATEGKFT